MFRTCVYLLSSRHSSNRVNIGSATTHHMVSLHVETTLNRTRLLYIARCLARTGAGLRDVVVAPFGVVRCCSDIVKYVEGASGQGHVEPCSKIRDVELSHHKPRP